VQYERCLPCCPESERWDASRSPTASGIDGSAFTTESNACNVMSMYEMRSCKKNMLHNTWQHYSKIVLSKPEFSKWSQKVWSSYELTTNFTSYQLSGKPDKPCSGCPGWTVLTGTRGEQYPGVLGIDRARVLGVNSTGVLGSSGEQYPGCSGVLGWTVLVLGEQYQGCSVKQYQGSSGE